MQWLKPVDEGQWDNQFEQELLSVWRSERTEHTLRGKLLELNLRVESTIISQVVSQMLPFLQEGFSTEAVKVFAWTELTKWFTFVHQRTLVKRMADEGIAASWNPVIVATLISEFFQFASEGGQTLLQHIIRHAKLILDRAHAEAGCTA